MHRIHFLGELNWQGTEPSLALPKFHYTYMFNVYSKILPTNFPLVRTHSVTHPEEILEEWTLQYCFSVLVGDQNHGLYSRCHIPEHNLLPLSSLLDLTPAVVISYSSSC